MNEDIEVDKKAKIPATNVPTVVGVMASILLLVLVTFQNPGVGGPVAVLLFLLLVFVIAVSVSNIFIERITKVVGGKKMSRMRTVYTSVVLGVGIVFLVGLQTLRQLQPVDVALVVAFEALLIFYLLRRF